MASQSFDYTVADFAYVEDAAGKRRLRLFMPITDRPVPVVVDLHGGAWCNGALAECEARDLVLARAGLAAAALDFRHGGSGYPTSLIDINLAIRWLKANAKKLGLRADRVGLSGQSSGGHLAMLAAMRPHDPRYASAPTPDGAQKDVPGGAQNDVPDGAQKDMPDAAQVDATVQAVAMQWPVINPLSRYRNATALQASGNPPPWVGDIPSRHDLYWKTTDAMAEGNPMLILERGEPANLPPALWIQGRPNDGPHDYRDPESPFDGNEPERFAHNYVKAGGNLTMVTVNQANRLAESHAPTAAFLLKHLG